MHEILINNDILFKINALLNIQMFNTLCVLNFIFESLQVFLSDISNSATSQPWGKSQTPIQFTWVWVFKFVFNSCYVTLFQLPSVF